jgi:succinylglutamate desuccinylase
VSVVVVPDPKIPGVTRISNDPNFPRPHVAIVGSLHGNEPCGSRAIDRIIQDAESGTLPLRHGTIILIHGNPPASEANLRYTAGGVDLNRLFDFEYEERLRDEQWTVEHHRALQLKPIFASLDAALDIHSAKNPSPPFVIVTKVPQSAEIAQALGIEHITFGWEDLNLLSGKVFIEILTRRNKPSVAVECGQHEDPNTFPIAYNCARKFLGATGVMHEPHPTLAEVTQLQVACVVEKPTRRFRFTRDIHGLQQLSEGFKLGTDGEISLHIDKHSWVLLPNDLVPVGADMLYLAREKDI